MFPSHLNTQQQTRPLLVEPGARFFFNKLLAYCHDYKERWNNTIFNFFLFICFISIITIFLIYRYKGKMTKSEKERKETEKYQLILSKINQFKETQLRKSQDIISGLPLWDNEYPYF